MVRDILHDVESESFPSSAPLKRSEPSSSLSRYAAKSGMTADEDGNLLRRKRQRTDENPSPANSVGIEEAYHDIEKSSISSSPSSPSVIPESTNDPEQELARLREKRKRVEHEEEEEDVLAKKRTTPPSNNGKKQGIGAGATNKFKLLFGAKRS